MNFTLGHVQCDANPYYGLFVCHKLYASNENMSKTMSTVYPTESTLFYTVKNYCEQMRHMCAILKCD